MGGLCRASVERGDAYESSVENFEGKLSPRIRWEDNIKMNFKEMKYEFVEWLNLIEDRDEWRVHVNTAINI
jgi:hypothetical protein